MNPIYTAWKLAFQLSPIMLVDGLATNIPGSTLPIIAITEATHFLTGILSGTDNVELDNFFAHFQPMPGATLINYQIGQYPFANQVVAANAVIAQPLQLSILMTCPARDELGYPLKLATMTALKQALDSHVLQGGTFTVLTPSYFYTNGILIGMRDASDGQSKQPQSRWQFDFEFPLLTLQAAQQVQSSLMNKLSNGTQIQGQPSWSGLGPTVADPGSLVAPSVVPASSALPPVGPFQNLPSGIGGGQLG